MGPAQDFPATAENIHRRPSTVVPGVGLMAGNGRNDWHSLIADIEAKMASLGEAVARLRSAFATGGETEPPDQQEIATTAESALSDGPGVGPPEAVAPTGLPDLDAIREEVRRAVEEARAELARGDLLLSFPDADSPSDDEPPEHALTPKISGGLSRSWTRGHVPPAASSRPDGSGPSGADALTSPDPALRQPTAFAPGREARLPSSGGDGFDSIAARTPTIVIEDEAGRVELVSVYRMLSEIRCASTANLLNYTAHSVTVALDNRPLPPLDLVERAARDIFGRDSHVEVEGSRILVRVAGRGRQAA